MAGRILVLDDEENYAEMLQDLLRENNYRVDMATRPERAIAQLEEIPYDLVISDYKMPVMDGADFLKKSRDLYPNLPFILVSGLMNTPELVKVANMSVTLVMEKPLDTETFLAHVARFSAPMTEQEKEQFAGEGQVDGEVKGAGFPGNPRFFSASNFLGNHFLQNAWRIAKEGAELFVLEPPESDVELAIRDISCWRGNDDMPVEMLAFADSDDEALEGVRQVLQNAEKSRVIGMRLNTLSKVARAQKLTERARREIEGAERLLLVYVVTTAAVAEFEEITRNCGIVLPKICQRPSDIAVYARRVARIAAERTGDGSSATFTPEAAYALLAFGWPRNYKQIWEVVQAAVQSSPDASITLEALNQAMGRPLDSVAPKHRIATLMKTQQRRYLDEQMELTKLTAPELAKELEIDASIETKSDLQSRSLVCSGLNHF